MSSMSDPVAFTVKKKFLLANKHITKLNSTLSVRIEELNAQISTLYTENLRLRASEIALAAQLKREREKSRQIIAETEVAALGLTKRLSFLRQAFHIAEQAPQSPSPTPPKATRRPVSQSGSSPTSPVANKLSRVPTVSKIQEDDELALSSEEEPGEPNNVKFSSRRGAKTKSRLSASRLPLPSRIASPPPPEASTSSVPLQIDFESLPQTTSKRKVSRRQSGLLIDTRMSGYDSAPGASSLSISRPSSPAFGSPIRRAAGLAEERDENAVTKDLYVDGIEGEFEEAIMKKPKSFLKKEKGLAVAEPVEKRKGTLREQSDILMSEGAGKKPKLKDVTNSPNSRPVATPVDAAAISELEVGAPSSCTSHLPTPSPPPGESEGDEVTGGRERRTRKSVNYAEPKLNTKMRKPDPPEGPTASSNRKRSTGVRSSMPSSSSSSRARAVDIDNPEEKGAETDPRSSLERDEPTRSGHVGTTDLLELPPSFSSTLRRNKSRPILIEDEDADDGGADADEEFVPSLGRVSWVNVGERRRGGNRRVTGGGAVHSMDERRHSIAL
ncbi:hypothetical protein E1B28_002274 [Marasmius oreades]|uniref:Shugoshin C-terminal domain-containing protein n=1 Tax=Marasmius oreades TaxID=181124 RepID=A0A9P7RMP8_9AGAR|nr:uncharacterized protein E1B28_002274 [Marasmius oreades]KAG7086310.1 hypothetical protein E1B28_002274 [Marasmius oreades]